MRSRTRSCLTAGFATAAALICAGPATAEASGADVVLQAQTAATALHLTLTQQPASSIITASLVDDAAADTASAFDSTGGSEAQSAAVYPGNLVVQGPALFCTQVFTCPFTPPDYPLLADASYPRRNYAEASSDQPSIGSGPLVVTPSTSVASAGADRNNASTATGATSIMAGTPVAITVGSSSATTRITSAATTLVTHVESTVSNIEIGGLVHVGSVRASDDITVGSSGKPVDAAHITVNNVTVAGVAAQIDERGIHVAGQNGPELTQRVAQQGIDIRTVGTDHTDSGSLARSEATALSLTFSLPVSGVPYIPNPLPSPFDAVPGVNANGTYVGYVTIGAVGAVAGANAEPAFALGGAFPLSSVPSAPAGSNAAIADNPLLGLPASTPGAPLQAGGRVSFVRSVLDGFRTDLANLYAVLALGTVLLFIGWRASVALRRHRPAAGRGG